MPDAGDMEKCDENGRLYPESESFEVSGVEPTSQMKTFLSKGTINHVRDIVDRRLHMM